MSSTEEIYDNNVVDELETSFLEYSMSVITARALPDVRDGLKPVQRRILYTMNDMGMKPGTGYQKSARTVGDCMGRFHPHGDSSIYEALVRMAQSWSMRLLLVDGHGNFGSLGQEDPPAASRYTEAIMAPAALGLTGDLQEETVDFMPTYDGRNTQPVVLPAAFCNLLVNGSSGIAVGMATNIPPHNLGEITKGILALLENPNITLDEMMKHVPGPDFPTGGVVVGEAGIKDAYKTGRGSFKIRAKAEIGDVSAKRKGITITELPYSIGPEKIIEAINKLKNQKRLLGVSRAVDLTDRKRGLSLVIECKTGFSPAAVLEELYQHTPLEQSFGMNCVALVNRQPRQLGLMEVMQEFIKHRWDVTTRRTQFRKNKIEARAHIIEGLVIALADIEEVIKVIRSSRDSESAKNKLMRSFKLSEIQSIEILGMPLRRLTSLEVNKLKDELKELKQMLLELNKLLTDRSYMQETIARELQQTSDQYDTPRRSQLLAVMPESVKTVSTLIPDEPCSITLSGTNLIARFMETFKGKANKNDIITSSIDSSTTSQIGAITSQGRLLKLNAVELPLGDSKNKGGPVNEFFDTVGDEKILSLVSLKPENTIIMVSKNGLVKALEASAIPSKTQAVIFGLKEEDTLCSAFEVKNTEMVSTDLLIVANNAQLLRTPLKNIPPKGAAAGGIAGMKIPEEVIVLTSGIVKDDSDEIVFSVSDQGGAKASKAIDYPSKGRGGGGVRCQVFKKDETSLIAAWIGKIEKEIVIVGEKGEVTLANKTLVKRDSSATSKIEHNIKFIGEKRN